MSSILTYIIRRLLYFIPTVIAITLVIHLVLHFAGADPVRIMLGDAATKESVAFWTKKLGLDQPVMVQYWQWLKGLLHGNLGMSLTLAQGFSVSELIKERLPTTAFLSIVSLLLSLMVALPAGVISALRRRHIEDYAVTTIAVAGISMPDFWFGFMLVILFSININLFPSMGYVRLLKDPLGALHHILLPSIAIAGPMAAIIARMVRASILDTITKEYVTVARAFGFSSRDIFFNYVWRNSLIPIVTIVGLQVRYLLGGVVVIEKVFSLPGIGSLLADAAFGRDIFLVQGIVVVFLFIILVINLIVDISYVFIDRRVRF
ncbi:MAG: ABC transporter permease [Thermodesulfobacteriota bacterium]